MLLAGKKNLALAVLIVVMEAMGAGLSCRSASNALQGEVAPPPQALVVTAPSRNGPRAKAAQALLRQGQEQLESGEPEASIASLQRAVDMDPNCGACSFWLAEAWLVQGDKAQAREHHQRAQRLLGADSDWEIRLKAQGKRL